MQTNKNVIICTCYDFHLMQVEHLHTLFARLQIMKKKCNWNDKCYNFMQNIPIMVWFVHANYNDLCNPTYMKTIVHTQIVVCNIYMHHQWHIRHSFRICQKGELYYTPELWLWFLMKIKDKYFLLENLYYLKDVWLFTTW